jgi:hypothetical protein
MELFPKNIPPLCASNHNTPRPAAMAPISTFRGSKVAVKERDASSSDEEESSQFRGDNPADSDKDSTEEELERLVFGDNSAFRDGLRTFAQADTLGKGKELVPVEQVEEEGQTGLEHIDDADVCWLTILFDAGFALTQMFF